MEPTLRERLRAGDPAAFSELFDQYAGAVYRHAVRTGGDRGGAEDIVSLTFLEAWRNRRGLRPDGDSALPWLLGIATNVLRNATRGSRRYRNAMARLPVAGPAPDFADEVVGRLADADALRAARTALRQLRRDEQEVISLFVWAGLDYHEVAEALGIPVGTVRSRLSRARARLRAAAAAELAVRGREPRTGDGQVQGGRATAAQEKGQ